MLTIGCTFCNELILAKLFLNSFAYIMKKGPGTNFHGVWFVQLCIS